jgi:hypothetical protein
LHKCSKIVQKFLLLAAATFFMSAAAISQTTTFQPVGSTLHVDFAAIPNLHIAAIGAAGDNDRQSTSSPNSSSQSDQPSGIVRGTAHRVADDQKHIYFTPLKPSNFKWDAVVLGGTALFLATDRHIENNLPGSGIHAYQATSDIGIGVLGASLAGLWLYGVKGDHPKARETGELELNALIDTFIMYVPMQFIAGRQRPGEGNGHGDFLKHHAINTSFPGGHAMFTWTMATVLSNEYFENKWAQAGAYGAAFTVTLTRFLARDHWASDMWVGTALGVAIGAHVFHAHCDPNVSEHCKHHQEKMERALHLTRESLYRPQEYYSGLPISH